MHLESLLLLLLLRRAVDLGTGLLHLLLLGLDSLSQIFAFFFQLGLAGVAFCHALRELLSFQFKELPVDERFEKSVRREIVLWYASWHAVWTGSW